MLDKEIQDALNAQMNFEMFSANIYMSMAAWFDSQNLTGLANWMKIQYSEESFHFTKFYDYIDERGGRVLLSGMDAPPTEWDSPLAAFEHALSHEQIVTGRINDLITLAAGKNDHATQGFLQWFVAEQVEEEASVDGIVQQLKLMQGAPGALFMLDRELGQRVFTPPTKE